MTDNIYKKIEILAKKYSLELKKQVDIRMDEMKDDDLSRIADERERD